MRFSDFSDLRAKTEVEGITARGLLICEFGTADLTVGTHEISSQIRKLAVLGEGPGRTANLQIWDCGFGVWGHRIGTPVHPQNCSLGPSSVAQPSPAPPHPYLGTYDKTIHRKNTSLPALIGTPVHPRNRSRWRDLIGTP